MHFKQNHLIHKTIYVFAFSMLFIHCAFSEDADQKGTVPTVQNHKETNIEKPIYLFDTADYKEEGKISKAAIEQCGMDKVLTTAVADSITKNDIPLVVVHAKQDLVEKENVLTLRIDRLVGAKSNGAFGPQIISEMGVWASYKIEGLEQKNQFELCNAGLMSGISACQRYTSCASKIAKELTKWIVKENAKSKAPLNN